MRDEPPAQPGAPAPSSESGGEIPLVIHPDGRQAAHAEDGRVIGFVTPEGAGLRRLLMQVP